MTKQELKAKLAEAINDPTMESVDEAISALYRYEAPDAEPDYWISEAVSVVFKLRGGLVERAKVGDFRRFPLRD